MVWMPHTIRYGFTTATIVLRYPNIAILLFAEKQMTCRAIVLDGEIIGPAGRLQICGDTFKDATAFSDEWNKN